MNKYHETMVKAFDDAMELLTKREQEEYNALEEEKNQMWMQALDEDAEAVRDFLELMR